MRHWGVGNSVMILPLVKVSLMARITPTPWWRAGVLEVVGGSVKMSL